MSTANIAHAGSAFAGGSKIAYDPRDLINQGEEDAKQGGKAPRLTIMEEVLLLGLKDKQVRLHPHWQLYLHDVYNISFPLHVAIRDTFHSGTTTSRTPYEGVYSSNLPYEDASPSSKTPTAAHSLYPNV